MPGVLWSILILILLLLPGDKLPSKGFLETIHFDKLIHLFLFAVFAELWRYGLKHQDLQYAQSDARYRTEFIVLLTGGIYSVALEFFQYMFILARHFDIADILANTSGLLIGLIGGQLFRKK